MKEIPFTFEQWKKTLKVKNQVDSRQAEWPDVTTHFEVEVIAWIR